jgi:predicted O-methyltransferase YrrM
MTHRWEDVDAFLVERVVGGDPATEAIRESTRTGGLPSIEVAANQGAFLALLVQIAGARRVLEFGTLGGYSSAWLARAVGPDGRVTTLELDPRHAALARDNLAAAGVADRVDIVVGAAQESAQALVDSGAAAYDLVFIDADKASMPAYLELALQLTHPGSVIVGDNVVRGGMVLDADSTDPAVQGTRQFLADLGSHPRLTATAVQTVGSKGWDGFAIALVTS